MGLAGREQTVAFLRSPKIMASTIPVAIPYSNEALSEVERAQMLARRYHAEFVDLKNFKIQVELFKSVPVDMMFRYNFVPLEQSEGRLAIAVADPSKLMVIDEISGLLAGGIVTRAAALSRITDLLKKNEQSQRVLDEASEGLALAILSNTGKAEENISIEKLTKLK